MSQFEPLPVVSLECLFCLVQIRPYYTKDAPNLFICVFVIVSIGRLSKQSQPIQDRIYPFFGYAHKSFLSCFFVF